MHMSWKLVRMMLWVFSIVGGLDVLEKRVILVWSLAWRSYAKTLVDFMTLFL